MTFQVSRHSVEPILSNRCRNLLSHDDIGPTGTDEAEEDGPEVAFVFLRPALAGDGEGLAGTGAGPEGAFVGPTGKAGTERPASDPGEEVTLRISKKLIWADISDAPFVDVPRSDMAGGDQVAQPLCGVRVELVVVGARHQRWLSINVARRIAATAISAHGDGWMSKAALGRAPRRISTGLIYA